MEGKKTSRGALQSGHRCGQVAPALLWTLGDHVAHASELSPPPRA